MTPIVAFVIMIQHIFPSWALARTHCTIVDSFIFIHLCKIKQCIYQHVSRANYPKVLLHLSSITNEDYLIEKG